MRSAQKHLRGLDYLNSTSQGLFAAKRRRVHRHRHRLRAWIPPTGIVTSFPRLRERARRMYI